MSDENESKIKLKILGDWIAQRDDLSRLIEALQRELGMQAAQEQGATMAATPLSSSPRPSGPVQIRADEFFGMSQTDAAATYLKKVGHAVHINQILDALRAGGSKFSGEDPKTNLYTVLVRGTKRFVLVSPSTFGLIEFYPNRVSNKDKERVKTTRENKAAKKTVRKTTRPRATSKNGASESKKSEGAKNASPEASKTLKVPNEVRKEESPTTTIVREALRGGQSHTIEALMKVIADKTGKAVPKITVLSILKMKEFEKVGAEYKKK
jgi:hypothetical protein